MLQWLRDIDRKEIKMKADGSGSYAVYYAEFQCSYCGRIVERRRVYKNIQYDSCGCQKGNIKRGGCGPISHIRQDRAEEALQCIHYRACLAKAAREDKRVMCENCPHKTLFPNNFHGEVQMGCQPGFDETTEYKIVVDNIPIK